SDADYDSVMSDKLSVLRRRLAPAHRWLVVKTRFLPAKREWCRQQWQAKSKRDRACSLRRHRGPLQTTDQRAAPFSTSSIGCWTFGVGRLLEDFSVSSSLTSLCFLTLRRSGTPCCSSKHDSKLFKSTGTRGCAPFGAALRYCTGHAIGCSSSRAARNGQYGSRKNSRAIITASACPVGMMCSACTGEVIIPTVPVMTSASRRIFWAKAVW